MKNNFKAFTFVELIITTLIITILTSIGFISYIGFIADSRDAQRKSDLSKVSSSLKIYKQKRGEYSAPGDSFTITNGGFEVAKQGKMNKSVYLNTLDKLPFDPKTKTFYSYSVTSNQQEYELAATLENEDEEIALLEGNYKTVSKEVLPSIMLAINSTEDIEIHDGTGSGSLNRTKFIFDLLQENLPYTMNTPNKSYSEGVTFDALLTKAEDLNSFWQNNDYRNCIEISEAKKIISDTTDGIYQTLSGGILVDTVCDFN